MEEWKDIEGYEGIYQISSHGRVKSLPRKVINNKCSKERILKLSTDKRGVNRITLHKNNKMKTFQVHRLVATAFLDNPNNLPCINHKDENPSNNKVENLEWCTREYNNNYGSRNSRISKFTKGSNNHNSKKVECTTTKEIFSCMTEAANKYNVSQAHITHCCQGKRNYTGKHPTTGEKLRWKFIMPEE